MAHIKVVIVDDDLDWLKLLTGFLNRDEDLLVVGTAVDRRGAVQLSRNQEFDIMLLDINMQGNRLEGIYAAMDILSDANRRIIMVTSLGEAEIVMESFAAGAVNYIHKENYLEIPNLIRSAMKENYPLEVVLKEFRRLRKEEQLQALTSSELEIFKLAEQGYKRAEIGAQLFKSENTVKKHIKLILQKLNAANLKGAIQKVNHKAVIISDDQLSK